MLKISVVFGLEMNEKTQDFGLEMLKISVVFGLEINEKTQSGKTYTLYNIPLYYAGHLQDFLHTVFSPSLS